MTAKKAIPFVFLAIVVGFLIYRVATGLTPLSFDKDIIGTWIAAFLTIAIYSFLYKDNCLYKIAEAIFIGVSSAYWFATAFWGTLMTNCFPRLAPVAMQKILPGASTETNYFYIIPFILGIMYLMRLSNKYGWMSRWALAYVVGFGAAFNFFAFLISDFTTQIRSSILPLIIASNGNIDWGASFSALVLFTGLIASLVYFFFSKEHKGVIGKVSRYGTFILMITFGASFAYTVMGRVALLIGRLQFLLNDWLRIGM